MKIIAWFFRTLFYLFILLCGGKGLQITLQHFFNLNLQYQYCYLTILVVLLILMFVPVKDEEYNDYK